jgi:uncharacterized sulfatase
MRSSFPIDRDAAAFFTPERPLGASLPFPATARYDHSIALLAGSFAPPKAPCARREDGPDQGPSRMKLSPLTLGLLTLLLAHKAGAEGPPNVVLIIADDQGWRDYGFMGHPHVRTPRIDRLAAESVTYRQGHVPSSLCSPSLASILTGLYPHQHKVTSNDPPLPAGKTGTAATRDPAFRTGREAIIANFDRVPTLPRLLADRGYASFQAGKWWGGHYKHGGFTEGMSHGDPDRGGRHGDQGLDIGRKTMTPVTDFIDRSVADHRPFFLWYAPMLPHSPHDPPERLLTRYREVAPSLEVAKYWACIEWFDETVGALLDHLDAVKVRDDTLVIFLADNGWIQDPTADRYAPRSKQSPYEGGLRAPILVRWPAKMTPRTSDVPVSSTDIAPTVLKACGVTPPVEMRGLDLTDEEAINRRQVIYGAIFTHNAVDVDDPASSLRWRWTIAEGRWKLLLPDPVNEPGARPELYDIIDDPDEQTNLADRRTDQVRSLRRLIDLWWIGRPRDKDRPADRPAL